jgi:hypothetical protein
MKALGIDEEELCGTYDTKIRFSSSSGLDLDLKDWSCL